MTQKSRVAYNACRELFIDDLQHKKCVDEAQPLVRNQDGGGQQEVLFTRNCITNNASFSVVWFHFLELGRMDDYGEDVGWDEAAVCWHLFLIIFHVFCSVIFHALWLIVWVDTLAQSIRWEKRQWSCYTGVHAKLCNQRFHNGTRHFQQHQKVIQSVISVRKRGLWFLKLPGNSVRSIETENE